MRVLSNTEQLQVKSLSTPRQEAPVCVSAVTGQCEVTGRQLIYSSLNDGVAWQTADNLQAQKGLNQRHIVDL